MAASAASPSPRPPAASAPAGATASNTPHDVDPTPYAAVLAATVGSVYETGTTSGAGGRF